jgi:regulatory protein
MPSDSDEKTLILGRMMRLCAGREYCRSEIRRKLAALPATDAQDILDTLCREGYLDDARYARAFARDKSALQGWGSLKIKLALQQKQIDAEAIAAALECIDLPAADARMEQLLRAKWKALAREEDPARKEAKFFRYALGRGYGYEEIKRIYDYLRRD